MVGQQAALVFCGTILIGELALLVLAVLISRAPLRAIGRLFFKAGRSKTAVDKEADPGFDATPDFKFRFFDSAFATVARVLRPESAIEHALNGIDEGFERVDGKTEGLYDFAHNEDTKLVRGGILFRWINVKPSYMPDTTILSDQ